MNEESPVLDAEMPHPKYLTILEETRLPPAPAAESELLEQAAASRPDILSQNHEISAGEKAEGAVRKSYWPRIDLRASLIQYGSNSTVGFPQLIGNPLPSLSVNVPSPGNAATADLESAESRVNALRDSVESERVLHDERLKFEAGRSVINFVLGVESALLTNQLLLSQAERSVSTAALALDLRMGLIDVGRLPNP